MKTYNFIYTIDNIECQIAVNASSQEAALETVRKIIPSATNIILINHDNYKSRKYS